MVTLLLALVFAADTVPAAPAVPLEKLVRTLGDDKFVVREAAQAQIMEEMKTRGQEIYRMLLKHKETETDIEITRRIERILADYQGELTKVSVKDYPELPWLDMLPPDHRQMDFSESPPKELGRQEVLDRYLGMSRPICGYGQNWPEYRLATSFWVSSSTHLCFFYWLSHAKSEEEFRREVSAYVAFVGKAANGMVSTEDAWWKSRNQANPLREVQAVVKE